MNCAPSIVYSQKFSSQSSAISPTTVFTPSADGLFRVSAAMDFSGVSDSAIADVWYDGSATLASAASSVEFQCWPNINIQTGNSGEGVPGNVFVGKSGVPIKLETRNVTLSGSDTYDLYITIEQLQ